MRTLLPAAPASGADFEEPRPSVAPLVDVSFLLLIFFLATTTLLTEERDLGMRMPPRGGTGAAPVAMVLEVRSSGEVVLNPGEREMVLSRERADHDLPLLRRQLEMGKAVSGARGPVIVLQVHDEARQQRVVDVLNCLQGSGVRKVSFRDAGERLGER